MIYDNILTKRGGLMYKNNIKKYRLEKGMLQKELAEKCGVSIGYISHLEKGSRINPSKEVMENIASVLNKSVVDIFFS